MRWAQALILFEHSLIAVTATGLIWSRYSMVIRPKNWNLFSGRFMFSSSIFTFRSERVHGHYWIISAVSDLSTQISATKALSCLSKNPHVFCYTFCWMGVNSVKSCGNFELRILNEDGPLVNVVCEIGRTLVLRALFSCMENENSGDKEKGRCC